MLRTLSSPARGKKVLYVLPQYHDGVSTNALHLIELIDEAAKGINIELFIEKATTRPLLLNVKKITSGACVIKPFNLIERAFHILFYRLKGGRNVYVWGSYWSALLASLIMRPSGGKVWFWHFEKFENYGQDIPAGIFNRVKWKVLNDWPLRWTLKWVNFLVTGTPAVAKSYEKWFDVPYKKIKVVPHGINLKRFVVKPREVKKKPPYEILFVHWLSPRKGVYELPGIIQRVISKEPRVHFTIVGDGPLRFWLIEEIKAKKLKKYTSCLGSIPNKAINKCFERADLFMMPSRQDAFPRVLQESMALGVPFISTDVGGIRDYLKGEQKKYLVPPQNERIFANTVVTLLKNHKERKALSRLGRVHIQDFDLPKSAKQFLELFKTC